MNYESRLAIAEDTPAVSSDPADPVEEIAWLALQRVQEQNAAKTAP